MIIFIRSRLYLNSASPEASSYVSSSVFAVQAWLSSNCLTLLLSKLFIPPGRATKSCNWTGVWRRKATGAHTLLQQLIWLAAGEDGANENAVVISSSSLLLFSRTHTKSKLSYFWETVYVPSSGNTLRAIRKYIQQGFANMNSISIWIKLHL